MSDPFKLVIAMLIMAATGLVACQTVANVARGLDPARSGSQEGVEDGWYDGSGAASSDGVVVEVETVAIDHSSDVVAEAAGELVARTLEDATAVLDELWAQSETLPSGSVFTVVATKAEIEAGIAYALAESGYADLFDEVAVAFSDSTITVSGVMKVDQAGVAIPGAITFEVGVDDAGSLVVSTIGATFNDLVVPPGMVSALDTAVQDAILKTSDWATLAEISVDDTAITVSGTMK